MQLPTKKAIREPKRSNDRVSAAFQSDLHISCLPERKTAWQRINDCFLVIESSVRCAVHHNFFLLVAEDITRILRDHETRLREHDVIIRKKSIDITSLQHQLFGVLRRNKARDEAIKFVQQAMNSSSFPAVSGIVSSGDDWFDAVKLSFWQ